MNRSIDELINFAGPDGLLYSDDWLGFGAKSDCQSLEVTLETPGSCQKALEALSQSEGGKVAAAKGGAVAIGALPFDPAAKGELLVPNWWKVVDSSVPSSTERNDDFEFQSEWPQSFELTPSPSHGEWLKSVQRTIEAVEADLDLRKVVLARAVDIVANAAFFVPDILRRLGLLYPTCSLFSIQGFIGASPEVLIRRNGKQIWSHPLAGTVPRSGDEAADKELIAQMLNSPKALREHRAVVEEIADTLSPVCESLSVPDTPEVVSLRNVSHLGTSIKGSLKAEGLDAPSALQLAKMLHPTPAVGGSPKQIALDYIAAEEDLERDRYAGPLGWVDGCGNGSFSIGIRSATIEGNKARICAGVGLVAGSDPEEELIETQLKFQALLAALVRP